MLLIVCVPWILPRWITAVCAQVLPGHWSPFVAAVRAVFNFCFGALIFMSAWGLALLVLWVSVALIAFPVHAAPVATLLLACFALTFLKATRLQVLPCHPAPTQAQCLLLHGPLQR